MLQGQLLRKQNVGTGWRILAIILIIIVYSSQYSAAAGPLNVYVVNYPLKYFAERIGGEHVKVEFPAPADVDPAYWNPDLRDVHDPELQKALDAALGSSHPEFWSGVKKKEFGVVVADATDLHHPKVAWYNPNLMLYAASLPKIAIVLGVFVEIERGAIKLDSETRNQLIRTIRHSSNRNATALLHNLGFERLAEILQDERYGKLYDPARGGGLWVGKDYGKAPAWQRDP
jgi:hypothetical protein